MRAGDTLVGELKLICITELELFKFLEIRCCTELIKNMIISLSLSLKYNSSFLHQISANACTNYVVKLVELDFSVFPKTTVGQCSG